MKHFFGKTGEGINISNRYSNIVSNTIIRNNNDSVGIRKNIEHKIIKFIEVGSLTFFIIAINFIE